tara:strand:+ start:274 stop:465 length:192 start_codon:yes stop_codon:yes gene_type:complete
MAVEFVLSVLVVGAVGCAAAVAFWLGFNRGHAQGWEGGRRAAETQAKLRYNSKPRVDADSQWT